MKSVVRNPDPPTDHFVSFSGRLAGGRLIPEATVRTAVLIEAWACRGMKGNDNGDAAEEIGRPSLADLRRLPL